MTITARLFLSIVFLSFAASGSAYAAEPATEPKTEAPKNSNGGSIAGLFLEPGVTYEFSDLTTNLPAPIGDSSGSARGLGLMARMGFHVNEIVFIAADGRYSRPRFKLNGGSGYESAAHSYSWGVTAGAQMPLAGARVWASYIAGGMIDPDLINDLDLKFSAATGFRLGAGFHISAISLNLEYQCINYGNLEVQQNGPYNNTTVFSGTELKNKSYVLSISFPTSI